MAVLSHLRWQKHAVGHGHVRVSAKKKNAPVVSKKTAFDEGGLVRCFEAFRGEWFLEGW